MIEEQTRDRMRNPEGGGWSGETRSGTATGLHSSGDVMNNSVVLSQPPLSTCQARSDALPRRQDEERASCAQRSALGDATAMQDHI